MIYAVSFLSGILIVAFVSGVAWFILSKWLLDRSLAIACVACGVTAGLTRFSHAGPARVDLVAAVSGVLGTVVGGLLVGRWWLKRTSPEDRS